MLWEHDICLRLTNKEVKWIVDNLDLSQYNSIQPVFEEILSHNTGKGRPISNKNRKNILKTLLNIIINPPNSTILDIGRLINFEKSFLGTSLSYHPTDTIEQIFADSTCVEISQGKRKGSIVAEINEIKVILTKEKNEEMSFINLSDQSGTLNDCICFPNIYEKYRNLLYEGNLVLITGYKSNKGGFIINSVIQV